MGKTTKIDEKRQASVSKLSDKHHIAIRELVSGKTDEEAAKSAGVSRQCLNGWKNGNPYFIAELSARRAEAWRSVISPLVEGAQEAMLTVRDAIKGGDVKTSMWLLDKLNFEEVLKDEFDKKRAAPRTLEGAIESIARDKASCRLEALNLDSFEYLESGEDMRRQFYREELEALSRQYGINIESGQEG